MIFFTLYSLPWFNVTPSSLYHKDKCLQSIPVKVTTQLLKNNSIETKRTLKSFNIVLMEKRFSKKVKRLLSNHTANCSEVFQND